MLYSGKTLFLWKNITNHRWERKCIITTTDGIQVVVVNYNDWEMFQLPQMGNKRYNNYHSWELTRYIFYKNKRLGRPNRAKSPALRVENI